MNTNQYSGFFSKAACGIVAVAMSLGISELVATGMERSTADLHNVAAQATTQAAQTGGEIQRLDAIVVTATHARRTHGHLDHAS